LAWIENKRLLLLVGLLAAAGVLYVALHGLPWSSDDEAVQVAIEGGDDGGTPAEKPGDANNDGTDTGGSGGASYRGSDDEFMARPSAGPSKKKSGPSHARVARIAERPKPEQLAELKEGLTSKNDDTRETAVVGIRRLGPKADTRVLIEALRTDESPAVRVAAATALGQLKCWNAGPALMDALADPDARVRSRAGAALDRIIGLKMGFRANGPNRQRVIRKIRTVWPGFYKSHLEHKGGRN